MAIYLSIISIASLLALCCNFLRKNSWFQMIFFIFSAIVLLIPLALRGMGVDYESYTLMYYKVSDVTWGSYWDDYIGKPEPFYALLNFFAYWFFDDYQGVNILCAVLSIFFTYAGLFKFRREINLGVAVWSFGFIYYLMMYGLNRMMIALSIITYAYPYFMAGKNKKMIFWSVIAGMFHYSAFLMIPFGFFLNWMRRHNKNGILNFRKFMSIIGIAMVFIFIFTLTPKIFSSFNWFTRYEIYFQLNIEPAALNNNWMTYPAVFLVVLFSRQFFEIFKQYKNIINAVFVFIFVSLVSVIMPVHRLCYYFYPAIVLIYSSFSRTIKDVLDISLMLYFIVLFFLGVMSIYVYTVYNQLWAPFINPYQMGNF